MLEAGDGTVRDIGQGSSGRRRVRKDGDSFNDSEVLEGKHRRLEGF